MPANDESAYRYYTTPHDYIILRKAKRAEHKSLSACLEKNRCYRLLN